MADIKVRVGQQNAIKVTSSLAGSGAGTIGELSDVNAKSTKWNDFSIQQYHSTMDWNTWS